MGLTEVLMALAGATGGGARGYLGQHRWQEQMDAEEQARKDSAAAQAAHRQREYGFAEREYGLRQQQFDHERKQAEAEERRRAVEGFVKAGQEAQLGYLNPERAYEMSRLATGDLGEAPGAEFTLGGFVHKGLSDVQGQAKAAHDQLTGALPEAYQQARRTQAPTRVTGGDYFGGVVTKPDVFSPYTGMSASLNAGARADANTLKATQQLLDSSKNAARSAASMMAPNLDAIFSSPQQQAAAIEAIKNAARNAYFGHYNVLVQAGQLPPGFTLSEPLSDAEAMEMLQVMRLGKSPAPAASAAVAPAAPPAAAPQAAPAPVQGDTTQRDPRAQRGLQNFLKKKGVRP